MKRLFFVRHGETEHNLKGVFSGQSETKLTNNGQLQARQAGQNLKLKLPHIDLIICSPYQRTYHTACIIAEEIGYPVNAILKNELFIERSYGALEGTSKSNYFSNHTFKEVDQEKGVETAVELHDRATRALSYLNSLDNYDDILVVSHGAFGRAIQRVIKNMPHTDEYVKERREKLKLGNSEIVELI
jgi:broad specificity phosphatase PhoE